MTANTCNGDMLPVFRDQSIHVNTGMITPRLKFELRCKDREKQSRLPFIANPVALRDATRRATDPCGHTSLPMQNSGKGRAPKRRRARVRGEARDRDPVGIGSVVAGITSPIDDDLFLARGGFVARQRRCAGCFLQPEEPVGMGCQRLIVGLPAHR